MENVAVDIELYWMLCKKNTQNDPQQLWVAMLAAQTLGSAAAVPTPLTATLTSVAGQPTVAFPGARPFAIKGYKQIWQALKKQKFVMEAGCVKKINFKLLYQKLVRFPDMSAMYGINYIANHTVIPMLICKGSVVGVGLSGPYQELTYARTKIGYLSNYTVNFRALATDRLQTTQAFLGNVAGSLTNSEALINDVDATATVINI